MKPKIFVAIGVMLAILAAGLTIILGLSSATLLPIFILSFLLIFFAALIFFLRESLNENIIATCIILFLVAISATIFLTSLKTYYDVVNTYGTPEKSSEISQIQSQNDYYVAYAGYLNQLVLEYQNQTRIMEDKLAKLESLNQTNQIIVSPNTNPTVIAPQNPVTTQQQNTTPQNSYITYSSRNREVNDD